MEILLALLSFTKVRDAQMLKLVIPAQAGIHWLLTAAKWIPAVACPRMLESGAGMTEFCEVVTHFGNSR